MKIFAILLLTLALAACSYATPAASPQPTASRGAAFCKLHIEGNSIKNSRGDSIVLHGANLPTLTEMQKQGVSIDTTLENLAADGARVVRLAVSRNELTPSFTPTALIPFVKRANELGMLVILSQNKISEKANNADFDEIDEWLRELLTYFNSYGGVWIDPIQSIENITPLRRRNIAQHFLDITRGLNADNVVVFNEPTWLLESDANINKPLIGANVIYGIDIEDMNRYPLERTAFIFTKWQNSRVATDERAIGMIALNYSRTAPNAQAIRSYWQAQNKLHPVNLRGC